MLNDFDLSKSIVHHSNLSLITCFRCDHHLLQSADGLLLIALPIVKDIVTEIPNFPVKVGGKITFAGMKLLLEKFQTELQNKTVHEELCGCEGGGGSNSTTLSNTWLGSAVTVTPDDVDIVLRQ